MAIHVRRGDLTDNTSTSDKRRTVGAVGKSYLLVAVAAAALQLLVRLLLPMLVQPAAVPAAALAAVSPCVSTTRKRRTRRVLIAACVANLRLLVLVPYFTGMHHDQHKRHDDANTRRVRQEWCVIISSCCFDEC
jgi:hypothetical protein